MFTALYMQPWHYYSDPLFDPYSDPLIYPSQPPICPPLSDELSQNLDDSAAQVAERIRKVSDVWESCGIGKIIACAPEFANETDEVVASTALNYEFARRVGSNLLAADDSVEVAHYRSVNIITLRAANGWRDRMVTKTEELAREVLEDLYQAANGADPKFEDSMASITRSYLAAKVDQIPCPELASLVPYIYAASSHWAANLQWRVKSLAEEVLQDKENCIWRLTEGGVEVEVLKESTSWWQRLRLRVTGWKNVHRLDATHCC